MEFLYSEKFLRGGSLLYVNKKSSNETYFEIWSQAYQHAGI